MTLILFKSYAVIWDKMSTFYDKLLYPLLRVSPRNLFAVADYQSLMENLIDTNKSLVVLISPFKMIQTAQ